MKSSLLESVFNHVAFPPKLPGSCDYNVAKIEEDLIERALAAIETLARLTCDADNPLWEMLKKCLATCQAIHMDGFLNQNALLGALNHIEETPVILHIVAQNAGLIIKHELNDDSGRVVFEAFEASAKANDVLASSNALICSFPSSAAALPLSNFELTFREALTKFLHQASTEPVILFAAKTRKAGATVQETRDTVDPAIILHMMLPLIEEIGATISVPILQKRIRDDVCWNEAEKPWRRNPFWLVLRVGMSRLLSSVLGPEKGRIYYKFLLCIVHAGLLKDSANRLSLEMTCFIKAKLSRRLAKLEAQKINLSNDHAETLQQLFQTTTPFFEMTLENVSSEADKTWDIFKRSVHPPVDILPLRAEGQDMRLTLTSSLKYLNTSLASYRKDSSRKKKNRQTGQTFAFLDDPVVRGTMERLEESSRGPMALSFKEEMLSSPTRAVVDIVELARSIESYLEYAMKVYGTSIELRSLAVLQTFEIWMEMDIAVSAKIPLLKDYHPGFTPNILDVLLISNSKDMNRLQRLQEYLAKRCESCLYRRLTIFSDPQRNCLPIRYLEEPSQASAVEQLSSKIDQDCDKSRDAKLRDIQSVNSKYEALYRTIQSMSCSCTRKNNGKKRKNCPYCVNRKRLRQLSIHVHEDLLPSDQPENKSIQRKVILFELIIPQFLAVYRQSTWTMIATLGIPPGIHSSADSPKTFLYQYEPLAKYKKHVYTSFGLASTTKSFLVAHYRGVKPPISPEQAILPFGLTLQYYDQNRKIWADRISFPITLAHHFGLDTSVLRLLNIEDSGVYTADSNGPSSYSAVLDQVDCPPGLGIHELSGYKALLYGRWIRWVTILRELGSTNINFSREETMHIIKHRCLQAGPQLPCSSDRLHHMLLSDQNLCQGLLDQIDRHTQGISPNWRESYCMNILLTIVGQIISFGSPEVQNRSIELLQNIRKITYKWLRDIRSELHNAIDDEQATDLTRYALLSGLLCKSTFAPMVYTQMDFDAESICCYIEASVSIQENRPSNLDTCQGCVAGMVLSDIKLTYNLRKKLLAAIKIYPQGLEAAIDAIWPPMPGETRKYAMWKTHGNENNMWIFSEISTTQYTKKQSVYYHLQHGLTLVNHKPLGRLPRVFSESVGVQELFGHQPLLVYPSILPGMAYMLARRRDNHELHFGIRDGKVIIQARVEQTLLEYVEREVFTSNEDCDLPLSFVNHCVHWLDLKRKRLEIRRKPHIWIMNSHEHWVIDVTNRVGSRRGSRILDPRSIVFHQIATIFEHFEDRRHLTVLQPDGHNITVELKRMGLSFQVNEHGLLYSEELRRVISMNQDAGTWYGLQSMLVLHDNVNHGRRSVIVPVGPLRWHHRDHHVVLQIIGDGQYALYSIDDVLGRMNCEPEPLLLFFRAQLHAMTSAPIPDSLTRRTGYEEAMAYLTSNSILPWTELTPNQLEPLMAIARLSPQRVYYPQHLRCQQQVFWDQNLTMSVQHDGFRAAIERILARLGELALFSNSSAGVPELNSKDQPHLRLRAMASRSRFERFSSLPEPLSPFPDVPYGRPSTTNSHLGMSRVREIVELVTVRPQLFSTPLNLRTAFDHAETVRGYTQSWSEFLLTDLLQIDVAAEWGPMVNLCYHSEDKDKYHLLFQLAVIAFGPGVEMDILRAAASFFILKDLRRLDLPDIPLYVELAYKEPSAYRLVESMMTAYDEPRKALGGNSTRRTQMQQDVDVLLYERECHSLAHSFLAQWPCPKPHSHSLSSGPVNSHAAIELIAKEWLHVFEKWQFFEHLDKINVILKRHWTSQISKTSKKDSLVQVFTPVQGSCFALPSLASLLATSTVVHHVYQEISQTSQSLAHTAIEDEANLTRPQQIPIPQRERPGDSPETHELGAILDRFSSSDNILRRRYAQDLMASLQGLRDCQTSVLTDSEIPIAEDLLSAIATSREQVELHFKSIKQGLMSNVACCRWLQLGHLLPCTSPILLLESLRGVNASKLGTSMGEAIYQYALSITQLQRLLRIYDAERKTDSRRLQEELQNPGHNNWRPQEYPDWLLLEVDGNFLIRANQVDVARAIISPASGANSVLQMNMGQGKTSVIMPMVACILADRQSLARLIIPRALLSQTAQVLQSRLGGLVGRPICHVPFSRRTPNVGSVLSTYHQLHEDIQAKGGVIIAQPDHVLAFRLSGRQAVCDGRLQTASTMADIQAWLDDTARDVIDECDFTLAVKTQLIYPSGSQLAVDGHPYRWKVTQYLLEMVEEHVHDIQTEIPFSLEITNRPLGGFPFLCFLRPGAEKALHTRLVNDICKGRNRYLLVSEEADKDAIRSFLTEDQVSNLLVDRACKSLGNSTSELQILYILRGLLVHGILILCLKKRWNVQYGLHPDRDPIAVPFHAKGVPSEQAEWGHPDVAIALTCLAFYYEGLTISQMHQCLRYALESDDPPSEYDRWIQHTDSLPDNLRHWSLINIDNQMQVRQIWQYLRFQRVLINYYLNKAVFPAHARQFKQKIQASGWDIPVSHVTRDRNGGANKSSNKGKPLTTGFSGTNDNRRQLPLTIQQEDLPSLLHTNAEVLTYLLYPRNRLYVLAATPEGGRLSERGLLSQLRKTRIRLLIDAGAHILELSNRDLVRLWLEVDHEVPAAVYYRSDNKAWVHYRNGKEVPLLATPFADNLEGCLVYLDEAHTRGVDLKFSPSARGALTLSLGQTKDHTVQAAMRLRQLKSSQSVVFFGSPEVHQSILDHRAKDPTARVDSGDVVGWLLEQTCTSNEQLQALYLAQGFDFCKWKQASLTYPNHLSHGNDRISYLKAVILPEQHTLQQLYDPRGITTPMAEVFDGSERLQDFWHQLRILKQNFQLTISSTSAFEEVEQERELAVEVEEIRQGHRPPCPSPREFPKLNYKLAHFARTGILQEHGWCEPLFKALQRTRSGSKYQPSFNRPSWVMVGTEFTKVTSTATYQWRDDFLRPVHWILWSPKAQKAVVIIPEEAELLIPIISNINPPNVYLIVYAAPITKEMLCFNNLDYYTIPKFDGIIPSQVKTEVGLLAGRLYFEIDEYQDIMQYLNPLEEYQPHSTGTFLSMKKPPFYLLAFLEEWFSAMRKGQDFTHTPMGYICQGRPLKSDHPFFTRVTRVPARSEPVITNMGGSDGANVGPAEEESDKDEKFPDEKDDGIIEMVDEHWL